MSTTHVTSLTEGHKSVSACKKTALFERKKRCDTCLGGRCHSSYLLRESNEDLEDCADLAQSNSFETRDTTLLEVANALPSGPGKGTQVQRLSSSALQNRVLFSGSIRMRLDQSHPSLGDFAECISGLFSYAQLVKKDF